MEEARAYTQVEVQEKFIEAVLDNVEYWADVRYANEETKKKVQEALRGFAFSMMVTLDGYAGALPKFILAPEPHEDDKEFHISRGEKYFPENKSDSVEADISGNLQDVFREMEAKRAVSIGERTE